MEVSCEHLFGLSGYIPSPRQTTLGVRIYECLAMLASVVHTVYIDDAWVAAEYLRSKAGTWKKENTVEAEKCWNLERILDAEPVDSQCQKNSQWMTWSMTTTWAALNDHLFAVKQYICVKTYHLSSTNLPYGPYLPLGI